MRYLSLIGLVAFLLTGTLLNAHDDEPIKEKSETEIKYKEAPEKVRKAFEKSDYKDWDVTEAEKVESKDHGTLYEFEVEKGDEKYELYYSKEGELVAKHKEEKKESKEHPDSKEHPEGGGHEHPEGQEHPK